MTERPRAKPSKFTSIAAIVIAIAVYAIFKYSGIQIFGTNHMASTPPGEIAGWDEANMMFDQPETGEKALPALKEYIYGLIQQENTVEVTMMGTTPPGRFFPQNTEIEVKTQKNDTCTMHFVQFTWNEKREVLDLEADYQDCCSLEDPGSMRSKCPQRETAADWLYHFSRYDQSALPLVAPELEGQPVSGPSWMMWTCNDFDQGHATCHSFEPGYQATYGLAKTDDGSVQIDSFSDFEEERGSDEEYDGEDE